MLIFRLIPRGLCRVRLEAAISSRISSSTALWNCLRPRGGNSAEGCHLAADNAHCVEKGQLVRILIGAQRGFVHEAADGEMGHEQAIELLPYQIRRLTAQDDLCSPQVSLELIERRLSGKGLARCADARPVSNPSP